MRWHVEPQNLKPRRFVIEHDKAAGFYLFIYENARCIRDHLQDTLEIAMEEAFEEYGVPRESWKETHG